MRISWGRVLQPVGKANAKEHFLLRQECVHQFEESLETKVNGVE